MRELKVAGELYQVGKLNAMQQLHVTRRLGPTLIVLGISMEMLKKGMKIDMDDLVASAGPVMEFVSKMSDEDFNYVVFTCLSVVKRQSAGAWAEVTTKGAEPRFMFADMEMGETIRLVVEVLRDNLGNFLKGLDEEQTSPSS